MPDGDKGFRASQLAEDACKAVFLAWAVPDLYTWESALKKLKEALAAAEEVSNGRSTVT